MKINPSQYKILIVDDVETNILLLQVLLTNEGFKVITASNGQTAIKLAKNEHPDLILLDVLMPDMTGFEVSQHLRTISQLRDIPIIFLTALDNSSDTVKGFRMGGNDYVSKPFNKDELMIRVEHQLSLLSAKRIILKRTKELRNTVIARDRLYSVIAHDLRSPMASIKMILNLLVLNIKEEAVGKDIYEMINMANNTTEDIFSLLDNLLKWTKSQIGKLHTIPQQTDLVSLAESTIEIFKNLATLKNIKIEFESVNAAEVVADIDMINTCMRNLISNAIKFSYSDNIIKVSIVEEPSQFIFSVEDFGCGMNQESCKNLLRTDTHFSTYGTANEEGSGLGLLLVQDFARKNGGELWFKTQENIGSTFYISIPKPKHHRTEESLKSTTTGL